MFYVSACLKVSHFGTLHGHNIHESLKIVEDVPVFVFTFRENEWRLDRFRVHLYCNLLTLDLLETVVFAFIFKIKFHFQL